MTKQLVSKIIARMHNSGLAKVAVSFSADTFVVNQTLVLRIKFSGENRHLRKAAKRQAMKKPNSNLFLQNNTPTIFLDFTSACLP